MPDSIWAATVTRIRSEFEEMPCLRVTCRQARMLFGLSASASAWILNHLVRDGFLEQTADGEYMRRSAAP
jgi:hypothetical protein